MCFLVLSLFYKVIWLIPKKTIIFKVPEGVQHFPGGSNFFQGGGGSNCLFPVETHITCAFPGGSGPPVPPLDPHLKPQHKKAFHNALNRYPNTKTTDMKQNTIKVKEPAIFFRENNAEPEKRMHENLSKMQGQTQRGKETLNKQQQNPFLRMDISSANRLD